MSYLFYLFLLFLAVVLIIYMVVLTFLKITAGKCLSKARLDNRTVVITGADKGIGFETALDLARRNARVIMACRDLVNAEKMANRIKLETGNEHVYTRKIDLSSLASVREFAAKFLKEEQRLDILINNAGIPGPSTKPIKTAEGFEIVFVTNYLGHFLLTMLLLDRVKQCSPSRVINVSSLMHSRVKHLDLTDLNCGKSTYSAVLYSRSKLLQVLFTKELARQLEGTGVTVNCLNPGAVATNIFSKSYEPLLTISNILMFLRLFKSPRDGAQTSIYAGVDESLENVSGQYLSDCRIVKSSKLSGDMDLAKKVFEISEEYIRKYAE